MSRKRPTRPTKLTGKIARSKVPIPARRLRAQLPRSGPGPRYRQATKSAEPVAGADTHSARSTRWHEVLRRPADWYSKISENDVAFAAMAISMGLLPIILVCIALFTR
jgi:hypothetical protein